VVFRTQKKKGKKDGDITWRMAYAGGIEPKVKPFSSAIITSLTSFAWNISLLNPKIN